MTQAGAVQILGPCASIAFESTTFVNNAGGVSAQAFDTFSYKAQFYWQANPMPLFITNITI